MPHPHPNKTRALSAVLLATALGGCVVQAAPGPGPGPYASGPAYVGPPQYAPPVGVAYVAPAYASPGPGYIWRWHRRFGWGWWHPRFGWHRGWAAY